MQSASGWFAVAGTVGAAILSSGASFAVQAVSVGVGAALGVVLGYGVDQVLESKEDTVRLNRYKFGLACLQKHVDPSIRIDTYIDFLLLCDDAKLDAHKKNLLVNIYNKYMAEYVERQ